MLWIHLAGIEWLATRCKLCACYQTFSVLPGYKSWVSKIWFNAAHSCCAPWDRQASVFHFFRIAGRGISRLLLIWVGRLIPIKINRVMVIWKHFLLLATLLAASSALGQAYEPPRNRLPASPDLQGFLDQCLAYHHAKICQLQRTGIDNSHWWITGIHSQSPSKCPAGDWWWAGFRGKLPDGTDLARGRGYNAFWVDPGTQFGMVKGEARTSWITYPENGRIPFSEKR